MQKLPEIAPKQLEVTQIKITSSNVYGKHCQTVSLITQMLVFPATETSIYKIVELALFHDEMRKEKKNYR